MSKQKVSREIPVEVIETDHRLEEQKKTASFGLDKHRWEQCADPRGPQHTQQAYADAVGRGQTAISHSVNAWAMALKRQNEIVSRTRDNQEDGDGQRKSTDAVEDVNAAIEAGQEIEDPTPEIHTESKEIAQHGEEKAALHTALAAVFGVAPSSLRNANWSHWRKLAVELLAEYASEMSVSDATAKAVRDVVTEKRQYDQMEMGRIARETEEASRPAGWMDSINPLMEMAEAGKRALRKVRGDLDAGLLNLGDDERKLIEGLLGEVKEITDRYTFALIVVNQ
jgi:hypothetical protein